MDVQWVRIRPDLSWHIIRLLPWERSGGFTFIALTRCGRDVPLSEVQDVRPAGKTCETCTRWLARQVDG